MDFSAEVMSSLNTTREIANLPSDTKHQLDTLGIAYLCVNKGGSECRQPFVVAPELSSDVLLKTTFIHSHVQNITVTHQAVSYTHLTLPTKRIV